MSRQMGLRQWPRYRVTFRTALGSRLDLVVEAEDGGSAAIVAMAQIPAFDADVWRWVGSERLSA